MNRLASALKAWVLAACLLPAGCLSGSQPGPSGAPVADRPAAPSAVESRLLADLGVLTADSLAGRQTGTPGAARTAAYLVRRFDEIGLRPLGEGFVHTFELGRVHEEPGRNVVGYVPGRVVPDSFLILSAHYDHVGVRDGVLYPGADDNGSGVAALLEIARRFAADPARHSVVFAAFDAEEIGLRGAKAFVEEAVVPVGAIRAIVNLDMVGRSSTGEIYVAGLSPWPALRPVIDDLEPAAPVQLRFGHDTPGPGDWTQSSDHGPFHRAGVPFLYFGVEDHPGYHHPSDTIEGLTWAFYLGVVETIDRTLRLLDAPR